MKELSESKIRSAIPDSIWMPGEPPSVYSGTPSEMVASMAEEMGGLSVREAVEQLCAALAVYRSVVIGLPEDVEDDTLAALFVFALLDTGLARHALDA